MNSLFSKFKLFFGVRTKKDLFLNEDFKKIALKNANFDYHPTLSREKWDGDSEDEDIKYGRIGHVQDNLGDNLQNKTFYICGLKELVIEAKELLLSKGVAAEDIVAERYS